MRKETKKIKREYPFFAGIIYMIIFIIIVPPSKIEGWMLFIYAVGYFIVYGIVWKIQQIMENKEK